MQKAFVIAPLVLGLPVGLIGFQIWRQDAAAHAAAGGSGVVEATDVLLAARISARVVDLPVHEGQDVKAGDPLLTLDCADPQAALAEAQARFAAAQAQAQAAHAQADATSRASTANRSAATASRAQADALATQRDAAQRLAARMDAQKDDVAPSNLDQVHASADTLAHQAAAAAASASATSIQITVASGQAGAARASADAADRSVEAAAASLRRAELLAAECVVRAPRDGRVESLPWEVGELVPLGATIVKLVDLREVKATFYLPNADLAAAAPGQAATLVADAWPDTPFPGTVATVSSEAEFTPRNIQTRSDRDRLVYAVEVHIPNPDGKLRPGMPVQVSLPGTEK